MAEAPDLAATPPVVTIAPAPEAPHAKAPVAHDPEDPSHALLHDSLNTRSTMLVVLTVLAVLATLKLAAGFFIPVMVALMFSYALSPVVDGLLKLRIPRALSAAALILGILGGTGASVWAFSDDANALIQSLPEAAKKLRDSMRSRGAKTDTIGTVQKAAAQLEQAAAEAGGAPVTTGGATRVVIDKPRFDIREHLWNGTVGLIYFIGQLVIVTFLTYFLLISGDTFRRKLVKITGPTLTNKKITVQALDEIDKQMQRYLLVQVLSSIAVGIVTGLAFWWMGLKHAIVWAFAAGLLNLVPYIGSAVVTGAAALVAFLQFGSLNMAIGVAGVSLFIHTISGNLVVPWVTSKASKMNAVAVFVGVLAWSWLWGVWGLLLGIPIMAVIKAVCDRVDDLKPVGELLGD